MFERILVPLDGTAFAEGALSPARQLAGLFGSRIVVARAVLPTSLLDPAERADPQLRAERLDDADAYLHGIVDDLLAAGFDAELVMPVAEASSGIARVAELERIDLIAVASHLYGAATREASRSVTLRLLDRSAAPVLVWHGRQESGGKPDGVSPGAHRPLASRHAPILVPLDGTALAEKALEPAARLAHALSARILLLRAIRADDGLLDDAYAPPAGGRDNRPFGKPAADPWVNMREAERYLSHLCDQLVRRDVEVVTAVAPGIPSAAIERACHDFNVGLIILATHSQAWFMGRLVSSVATTVIERIAVPALILRPEGARLRPDAPALSIQGTG